MIVLEIQGRGVIECDHSMRVGRDGAWADLVLDMPQISRHHLEIMPLKKGYGVWDLGSQNGTELNGQPVGMAGAALQVGDVVKVGGMVEIRVAGMSPHGEREPSTVIRGVREQLSVEAHTDIFIVDFKSRGRGVRDTMPFQLGLALSVLALYRHDELGPVPDVDLRAIVWRNDREQQQRGDINRLLRRIREWFEQRKIDPPRIVRPRRSATTQLEMPSSALQIKPEGWLYPYLEHS